jgi:predicted nucleotidyltransferase
MQMPTPSQPTIKAFKQCIQRVLSRHASDFAYLYGSVATGRNGWWSDVDLVVSWPSFTTLSLKEQYESLGKLALELEEKTGMQNLDLKVWQLLPLRVQFQILRDGILLVDKNPKAQHEAKEEVLLRYPDHLVWFKRYLAEVKSQGRL